MPQTLMVKSICQQCNHLQFTEIFVCKISHGYLLSIEAFFKRTVNEEPRKRIEYKTKEFFKLLLWNKRQCSDLGLELAWYLKELGQYCRVQSMHFKFLWIVLAAFGYCLLE